MADPTSPNWRPSDLRPMEGQIGGDAMQPLPGAEIDPKALAEKLAREYQELPPKKT